MPTANQINAPNMRGIICGYCHKPLDNPRGGSRICHKCYCIKVKEIRGNDPKRYIVEFERYKNNIQFPIGFNWQTPPVEVTETTINASWYFPPDSIFILRNKDSSVELLGEVEGGGFQADNNGSKSERGNSWCMPHANGQDEIIFRYRKRARNKSKTKPIAGYTPEVTVNEKRARKFLNRACRRLGFSYLNSIKLIKFSDKIPTACWYFKPETLEEGILINPAIASRSVNDLVLVIQHEVMHRALYRNMRGTKDKQIANIALDACINRIITQNASGTRNKKAMEFFGWIYPKESRKNIVAIANPTLSPKDLRGLSAPLRKLWLQIWGGFKDESGKPASEFLPSLKELNPRSIYYILRQAVMNGAGGKQSFTEDDNGKPIKVWGCPFGNEKAGDKPGESDAGNGRHSENQHVSSPQGDQMEKSVKEAISKRSKRGRRGGGHCDARSKNEIEEWMEENVLDIEDIESRALEDFASKMQTLNKIENVKARVLEKIDDHSIEQPYLENPTQFGIEMIALGLHEPIWPMYYNAHPIGSKKKVAVYLDLSPSMDGTLGYIPDILDVLENASDIEYHTGLGDGQRGGYIFAGEVTEISYEKINEMRKGKIGFGGYSTCFNAVAEHASKAVKNHDVDIIVMITDGLSSLSDENIAMFNRSGKHCYSIILAQEGDYHHDNMEHVIKRSRLSELNGDVLPLKLPKFEYDDTALPT